VSTDTGYPERDVLHLTAVGDGAEFDEGMERNLDPGQVLLGLLQEVSEQAPGSYVVKLSYFVTKVLTIFTLGLSWPTF